MACPRRRTASRKERSAWWKVRSQTKATLFSCTRATRARHTPPLRTPHQHEPHRAGPERNQRKVRHPRDHHRSRRDHPHARLHQRDHERREGSRRSSPSRRQRARTEGGRATPGAPKVSCPPVKGGRFAPTPIRVGDKETQPDPPPPHRSDAASGGACALPLAGAPRPRPGDVRVGGVRVCVVCRM